MSPVCPPGAPSSVLAPSLGSQIRHTFAHERFQCLAPHPESSVLHFCSIEAIHHFCLVSSFLLLLSLLAPKHLGVKPLYNEKGLGARWARSCPAGFLRPVGCPGDPGTSPRGRPAVPGNRLLPYQLPDKLQPNPEVAPPVFQFVV